MAQLLEKLKIRLAQKKTTRAKVPTVLQMEAVECGAASLAMILAYYGRFVPLEEMRVECGVSRDGSKASNLLKAARHYGMNAKGYRMEPKRMQKLKFPLIVFWNFNHYLVVEGFQNGLVYLNDPATGPRTVSEEEFNYSFTGVVLAIEPGPQFQKGGERPSMLRALAKRVRGLEAGLAFLVLAGLLLVVPGLLIPVFSKIFVDQILLHNLKGWLIPLLTGMGLTAVLRLAITALQNHYLLRMESQLALNTSGSYFWHVLRLPMEFFTQRSTGEIGNRVQLNDHVAQLMTGQLAHTCLNILVIIFYLILMLHYSVLLSLIGISVACVNIFYLRLVNRSRFDHNQKLLVDRAKLFGTSMAGLRMIETLKAGGNEADFFSTWSGYQAKLINADQTIGVSNGYLSVVPQFLNSLNTMAILTAGGLLVMNGELTVGTLVAFQSLMTSFLQPVQDLVKMGSTLQDMKGTMNRLDDVFHYKIDRQLVNKVPEDATQLPKLKGFVELRNITFGYSRLEPPLIENFNLILKPGSRVALVGGSGSGKSTVSKLVAGLYQPWGGEILFDGKPRNKLPRFLVTNSLAMVDQDIIMFEGTIRDNLTLWDNTIAEGDLIQAAKDACIHDDISSRDGGYDHRVTEGGRNFSGGQRQRLEIARALAGKPSILVLDEATSALDPRTEKAVNENLHRRGCTTLVVAHRLSTIRDCDEIIVLEKGKVVQRGSHEQMKDAAGPYAELIRIQ